MKVAGIAAAVALVGMMASGYSMAADGNLLLEQCQQTIRALDNVSKPSDSSLSSGQCAGLVEGVRYMMRYYSESNVPDDYKACFPERGVSTAQAVRVVGKYLKDNPEQLHKDGAILAVIALHNAFPCKK